MQREKFHHGNLREELLEKGMEVLLEAGGDALSLRNLGRELHVSPRAPYRHFSSKHELLMELASLGAQEMTDKYMAAYNMAASNETRLRQACMEYLNFAEAKPHLFKLILIDGSTVSKFRSTMSEKVLGHKLFEELVISLMSDSSDLITNHEVAISCWSMMHGFAVLNMNNRMIDMHYDKEQVINAVVRYATSSH